MTAIVAAIARLKLRNDSPEKKGRKMTDWVFVLLPLLVIPIVLLFRFVGCEEPKPEDEIIAGQGRFAYEKTILDEPSVLAYWRLVDAPNETKAKDEKGGLDGEYITVPAPPGLPPEEPNETFAGSEGTSGGGFTPDVESLIRLDPAKCRAFNSGYVLVAGFAKKTPQGSPEVPYPTDFTIEAWIKPQWTQKTDYERTLVHAGGQYPKPTEPKRWHGFRIFADREDRWRVYLAYGNGGRVVEMEAAPEVVHSEPNKPPPEPTHLAVTVKTDPDTSRATVTMFVNGKMSKMVEESTVYYSAPDTAPLFIGVDNTESNLSETPKPRHPVLSPIQEVVLYKKALSPEVIKKHHDVGKGVA